jgi:hypothetical protein
MTISKVDWKLFDNTLVDKLVKANPDIDLSKVYYQEFNNSFLLKTEELFRPLGCIPCLTGSPSQNDFGDITLGEMVLLNYKNLAIENNFRIGNDIAEELATNVWICPNCKRWIFDFLPKYDTMSTIGS